MTKVLNHYFPVLDDGFCALKGFMGTDDEIEQAARVSYGKGTRQVSDTKNLLRYLLRHHHTTPFEMGELKFHIRAPIYVIRQWHRHRTWSYNEYSGRYSEMIDSMEKTDPSKWREQSGSNKQGSDGFLSESEFGSILSHEESSLHEDMTKIYQRRLAEGVAKEQARKDLPVSNYTEMYAKVDLKNLFGFLRLRCDSHAQWEIRQYANIMAGAVEQLFPISFEAWYDYHYMASSFTRLDKLMLQIHMDSHLQRIPLDDGDYEGYAEEIGMGKRELAEFWDKLNPPDEQDFSLDFSKEY
jgi:thymidylate synthase (FAD)